MSAAFKSPANLLKKIEMENKRFIVLATSSPERAMVFSEMIHKHISNVTLFTSTDGSEAFFKIRNFPPHVVILDGNLPKRNGFEITSQILSHGLLGKTSVILITPVPDKEKFLDQVVTGQVQFLTDPGNEQEFNACITKALNRLSLDISGTYRLLFMTPEEILFNEGEIARSVYIVRKGQMQAIKNFHTHPTLLGQVLEGEFVGEMAHFSGGARSATVKAVVDCELIEIPSDILNLVLYAKPAWSQALINTLAKRLRSTSDSLTLLLKK